MNKKMLIDASYKEETRIVILDGNCIENYDVENATKKQLKGNIYLAKVIRIEPSLQAAFVEYGGNRHGFLAFSEIHPDYYQIPVADRNKLLELNKNEKNDLDDNQIDDDISDDQQTTTFNDDDEISQPVANILKNYKIQEVIHRRQILLIQVVKEERGNKGAALTTYLSLAGRYCVLMPNSLRGGGISRKITSIAERRRLKDIIAELNIPSHMGMIIRTAGAQCPKPDALKDGEYLLHLWDEIRDRTMKAVAPSLIYEDSSLLKRAIRDTYTPDIGEILIDGEDGWNVARDYMRALMPQNMRKLHLWRDQKQTLFSHYKVENLIDQMLSPTVQLKSGGYLVINQTEALVAIDVNSGRSIKEKDIEETALRTNLEAADELGRQLRLRDLAGLIVVDFIDMENRKHNYMVEKRLKNAIHKDRARIQVGSISSFGLLEMTRQRLRPSISEFSFVPCSHCNGTGIIRSTPSACLHILRQIDEEARRSKPGILTVYTNSNDIAFYILNQKRSWLLDIESKYKIQIILEIDTTLPNSQISFSHEINEALEQELEAEQEKADILLQQDSPFIREIPIQSESSEAVEATEEKDSYQQRKRRNNNNNRRSRYNNYRQHKDEQSELIEPIETVPEQDVAAIIVNDQDEQPDISFHPVVNQDEYFASKKEDRPKRSNRYPRQPRWKRNKYQQNNDENVTQEASENITHTTTIDITPITTIEQQPVVNTLEINSNKPESPAFIAIEITDKKENDQIKEKISTSKALTTITEPVKDDAVIEEKPAKRTRKTTKTTGVTKSRKTTASPKKKTVEASEDKPTEIPAASDQLNVEPVQKTTRGRKVSATKKVVTKTTEEKKAKPTARKTTTKQTKSTKSKAEEASKDNSQTPAIKPIVIDDDAPTPTPRAGWWKR
ncbi:Rne/Rng family ribonuclease [Commensalibacter papalotli (ex Servin-Garciduenas et al. 2014)]|uniref:Ribonuclease G n=1 Tax=Commensalibacter papalotli (ex Servin-Garciduenas et al. 2014) TaxID=1208583 RepID=W7DLW6_9PROT|nr:ribonuclease E/G [Commensalibacter papalotli (ex Servin-Garciduenas et al. 2014)]EUK18302.1 ribonuclease E [Commensalibacter papalotli (ex Servin-Garciduenas et al. 2014)]